MSRSEALGRAQKKYEAEKVDRIIIRVPKGERTVIQQHAAKEDESVNAFICRAIKEAMERDNANT